MVFGPFVALLMEIVSVITKSNRDPEGFVITRVHCILMKKTTTPLSHIVLEINNIAPQYLPDAVTRQTQVTL